MPDLFVVIMYSIFRGLVPSQHLLGPAQHMLEKSLPLLELSDLQFSQKNIFISSQAGGSLRMLQSDWLAKLAEFSSFLTSLIVTKLQTISITSFTWEMKRISVTRDIYF